MVLKNDDVPNTEENKKEKFKHLVYYYEKAIRLMKHPIFQITVVVEFKDSSLSLEFVKTVKGLFEELGEYYAERLYRIIVLNAPWTFGACWTFIKPLMPPHVIAKYIFIKSKNISKELSNYISPNELAMYGISDYVFDKAILEKEEKILFGDN